MKRCTTKCLLNNIFMNGGNAVYLLDTMKITRVKICKFLVLIIIFSSLLYGCNRNSNNQQPQNQQLQTQNEGDKVPDQLKSIESSIEKIINALNGPAIEIEEEKDKFSTQNDQNEKDETQNQGKDSENSKDTPKNGKDQQQEGKEGEDQGDMQKSGEQAQKPGPEQAQKQQDPWQKIDPIINSLHYQWNSYKPMAVKMNAGKDLTEGFSTALNSLTNTIIGKNKTNTLMAASYLYTYIPDFFMLYKTPNSPEIKRIRHYTRNAMLNGITGNWTQAEGDLTNLKSTWSIYKNILGRDQKESSNKLEYSIDELEKVIKERNQPLTDIKGRVALANIQALEKETEENQGKSKGGSQSGGNEESGNKSGNQNS